MSLTEKINAIEAIFDGLDKEIKSFQSITTLKCLPGCGKCCTHNQIDASPLEFLPWAYDQYVKGKAIDVLDALNANQSSTCYNYRPAGLLEQGKGSCDTYHYRGLICRLFGYGASADKYGKLRMVTCQIIKEDQVLAFHNAEKMIAEGQQIPIFTQYYMQLSQVDFELGKVIVPINTALKMALEEVLHYFMYRSLADEVKGAA